MPTKFKPSQMTVQRGSKTVTTQHFYIKNIPQQELFDYINNGQKPKIKQKCRNELQRRGVKIIMVPKS
jgi:hypothetical protein